MPHFYVASWLTLKKIYNHKITKICTSPRNSRVGNKLPILFLKKPLFTCDLLPAHKNIHLKACKNFW